MKKGGPWQRGICAGDNKTSINQFGGNVETGSCRGGERNERTNPGLAALTRRAQCLLHNGAVARRFRPTPPVHLFASACPINIVCSDQELLIDGQSPGCVLLLRGGSAFIPPAEKEAAGSSGLIAGQLNGGKLKRDESMRPGIQARRRPECEGQTRRCATHHVY